MVCSFNIDSFFFFFSALYACPILLSLLYSCFNQKQSSFFFLNRASRDCSKRFWMDLIGRFFFFYVDLQHTNKKKQKSLQQSTSNTRNYLIYCSIYLLTPNDCIMGLSLVVYHSFPDSDYSFSTDPMPPISFIFFFWATLLPHCQPLLHLLLGQKKKR